VENEHVGRVVLVTAAAGAGLGQAIARRFAADGASVVVTDVHEGRTTEVAAAIAADYPAATVVGYPLDVGVCSQIDQVVDDVRVRLGPVEVLVNNAAVNITRALSDCSVADWERTIAVNLTGPWYLSRQVMPHMRAAGQGVIINIGSYAGDLGVEGPYAVTKGGMNALTRACAREGAEHRIRAVTVSTGIITDTKWARDRPEQLDQPEVRSPLGSYPVTAEIAETVAFLASSHARHITGDVVNIGSGAYMRT